MLQLTSFRYGRNRVPLAIKSMQPPVKVALAVSR